jgi:DNA-directed RNA polymerase subunit M/transcription elongation factor TFIIS
MEDSMRDYARTQLASIFGEGPSVRNAEKSIYNWAVKTTRESNDVASWENRLFRSRYKQKVLHLLAEMKRGEALAIEFTVKGERVKVELKIVPQLVHRLKNKDLEMRKLAMYSPDVLWPTGPYATGLLAHKEKELAMERAKAAEKDYEGLFKCSRCKSTKTYYYQLQTRSADEPMVRCYLILCLLISLTDALFSRLRTSPARTVDTSGSASAFNSDKKI